ncbi:MAG TPA: hypothetical protein VG870_05825, partial [Chitinophagaceae bacterium]|nr:hypothetical protein [Chitinophagaceae bacterium]
MFPTAYPEILALLDQVDPVQYGRSRNFTSGAVTRLSPYISRGVISTRLILQHLLRRGASLPAMNKLVQELAWR